MNEAEILLQKCANAIYGKEVADMEWYELIELEPYDGDCESPIFALVDAINMNVHFDDVNCDTCRFCFKADLDSPIVDYDITFEELDEWFEGKSPLVLRAIEHDEERFRDLVFYGEGDEE